MLMFCERDDGGDGDGVDVIVVVVVLMVMVKHLRDVHGGLKFHLPFPHGGRCHGRSRRSCTFCCCNDLAKLDARSGGGGNEGLFGISRE
jgi:hypothetical protein